MVNIALQVALYLGLRNMEWLFLTSHNHWIVCRLVNDPHNPFLAYSPSISIEDSSVPFRALLGAMLSVYNSVSVPASVLSPGVLGHDGTPEGDQVDGSVAEDDTDDSSGLYVDSGDSTTSTITSDVLMTSSQAVTELMARTIPSHFLSAVSLAYFSDYFLLPALSQVFPSVGSSSAVTQQRISSSSFCQGRGHETTPMADPCHRIWIDRNGLAMSF